MEYTRSEKYAIKYYKNKIEFANSFDEVIINGRIEPLEKILNLIEKQRKEIEELNNKYNFEKVAKEEVEELLDDSIPKEKIRKKIEELNKKIVNNDKTITECRKTIMENQPEKKCIIASCRMENVGAYKTIRILKEILGDE